MSSQPSGSRSEWKQLAEAISKEADPVKLLELVHELNLTLAVEVQLPAEKKIA